MHTRTDEVQCYWQQPNAAVPAAERAGVSACGRRYAVSALPRARDAGGAAVAGSGGALQRGLRFGGEAGTRIENGVQ